MENGNKKNPVNFFMIHIFYFIFKINSLEFVLPHLRPSRMVIFYVIMSSNVDGYSSLSGILLSLLFMAKRTWNKNT